MEQRYLKDRTRTGFDEQIQTLVAACQDQSPYGPSGHAMDVGIKNEQGELYTVVRCWGLGEYIGFVQGMGELGFNDELKDVMTSQNGLDSLFTR